MDWRRDDRLAQLRSKALETHGADTVWRFREDFHVFSNFYLLRKPYYVTVHDPETGESDGIWYASSEQAYMAAKTLNIEIRRLISQMTAAEAKKYCRSEEFKQRYQRPDFWDIDNGYQRYMHGVSDELCVHFMRDIVWQKFADPQLRKILLDTGDAHIMEGNTWGDDFWGKVVNRSGHLVGKNKLGGLLMDLRNEFRHIQGMHQEEKAKFDLQSADFPVLGKSKAVNSSVLSQGENSSSPTEPSCQESAGQSALKPEAVVREMATSTTRCRRWGRVMASPNDSKAAVVGAPANASSDSNKETVGARLASLHDDGTDKEVRRLSKALREIDELELALEAVTKAGGRLRQNQMQKIGKKQEYLDKLNELALPVSVSGGS